MIKERFSLFRRLMAMGDACVVCAAFFIAYFLRDSVSAIYPLRAYLKMLPVVCLVWVIFLYSFKMYGSIRTLRKPELFGIIIKSSLAGFITFSGLMYLYKLTHISRIFVVMFFLISTLLIILEKVLLIVFFRHIRRKGLNYRNILVVGTGKRAKNFIDIVHRHKEFGFKIIGMVDEDASKKGEVLYGYKVLGILNDMIEIIHSNVVDEVIFIVPRAWLGKIEHIMHFCENEGLKVHVSVDYFELKLSSARLGELYGMPLLTFDTTPSLLEHLLIKRLADVAVSAVLLIILAPLFLLTAILIRLTSPGPVFFRQERCSLNGRRFTLYKFRTMVKGAESQLKDVLSLNEMDGPVFKITNDPRITGLGNFLRKFSIDELPQLYNVFKGDMSLVGPRPPIPAEVDKYDSWQRRRLSMRPGLTCLWQVNGRNKITDFNTWARLDLEYIDNWSLWLDVKLLFKTFPAVILASGAK